MTVKKSPVMLMILDGFGLGDLQDPTNAAVQGRPEHINYFMDHYPHAQVSASGLDVGLPDGQMGNSEVGHLNLGAGRIIYQELTRITKDAEEGGLFQRPVLQEAYAAAKKNNRLHLLGLLSDGGVHSHINHMKALVKGAKDAGIGDVLIHAFLDGRDVPPSSAGKYIADMEAYCKELGVGRIVTIGGRYYGMDRDKRWERVELAYVAIVDGEGFHADTAEEALKMAYDRGETDEFVKPTVIGKDTEVRDGDALVFANFRPDRARQLTRVLSDPDFADINRKKGCLDLYIATMTKYEDGLPVHIIYEKEKLHNTLGEVLAKRGMTQLRIAETEKYAHVTYFFNGGEEKVFPGEDRILVPSPKVATYDLQPEMSANEVTDNVVKAVESGKYDMIILNFANPDMVGHTGDFEAAKRAVHAVDACVNRVAKAVLAAKGHILLTADHGNCDVMVDHKTNIPHTAHTTNPVPLILISDILKDAHLENGRLCDLAPTMLDIAGVEQPEEMTGHTLLKR